MANKFFQPPDANPTGLDTLFSQRPAEFRKLADDWTCNETGEISKVTLWVSFLNDGVPQGGLSGVHLSVHADIPASPPTNPYSKPGPLLAQWDLGPSEFTLMPHIGPVSEYFWDPMTQQSLGMDTQIWQLDCFIPQGQRFLQQQGTIYWLDANVDTGDGGSTLCGWKTCLNGMAPDAAVWTGDFAPDPPPESWAAMQYPPWHQGFPGAPLNLSFAIETEPATTTTRPATTTVPPATTGPATTAPPGAPVPHPADTGPGAPNWSFGLTEVLAFAASWLNGGVPEFQSVALDGPGVAQAYILRAAAITLAHYQSRYGDAGSAEPINSAAHPQRWHELPDA